MTTQEALERASAALKDLAKSAESSDQRAVKAEQQVEELTNEIKRLKESEDAETTRLKEIIRGRRARVEELAEENRLLKRSADAAHFAGRELKEKVQEQENLIEELEKEKARLNKLWDRSVEDEVEAEAVSEQQKREIAELQQLVSKHQQDIASLHRTTRNYEGIVARQKAQLKKQRASLVDAREQMILLQSFADRCAAENKEYRESMARLKEDFARMEDRLAEASPEAAVDENERRERRDGETETTCVATNTESPLAPFRRDRCRCRVWKDGQGTQCSHAGRVNGMCGKHHSHVEKAGKGTWHFGFYDEPRPDIWGIDHEGKCLPVPSDRKEGTVIPWSMPQKEWSRAFKKNNE